MIMLVRPPRMRWALGARYSSESYQRFASARLGNSSTTGRAGVPGGGGRPLVGVLLGRGLVGGGHRRDRVGGHGRLLARGLRRGGEPVHELLADLLPPPPVDRLPAGRGPR